MAEKSAKYLEALKILPDDLVPIFDELLEHYKFAALKCHGRPMVSPLENVCISPLIEPLER